MGNACRKSEVRPETGYRKVTLNDFTIQRAIGKGAFGKVSIIQKKKGGQFYALKYINKAKCIQEKAVHHMIQERNLLEEIKHPFICNLRYSFQDADNLYMALDLMTGGDLRFHLGRPMKEAASKTILAEISSAIAFLHARNIVHRDVKPDNILLDEHGHAYLTDFNIAVKFRLEKPLKSVAGTEPYMAPELLNGAGYFSSVDWWSLGVMAYELLLGERPFRGKHKRELIKKGEWKFPPQPASNEALSINTSVSAGGMATTTSARRPNRFPRLSETSTSFISGLMTMDVNSRLGCGEEGQVCLMTHPFFEDLSWEKLERKEIPPVFVPAKNKSNFDATHDLEEILLNESPLGGKTKKGKESGQLSPEMVTIEKQFLYYDYSNPRYSETPEPSHTASMDLPKLHESTLSIDVGGMSTSNSRMMTSRSQGLGHDVSTGDLPAHALSSTSSAGFRGADDRPTSPSDSISRTRGPSNRRDDINLVVTGTNPGILRGGSGVLYTSTAPQLPPLPVISSQKMLLDETNRALEF